MKRIITLSLIVASFVSCSKGNKITNPDEKVLEGTWNIDKMIYDRYYFREPQYPDTVTRDTVIYSGTVNFKVFDPTSDLVHMRMNATDNFGNVNKDTIIMIISQDSVMMAYYNSYFGFKNGEYRNILDTGRLEDITPTSFVYHGGARTAPIYNSRWGTRIERWIYFSK